MSWPIALYQVKYLESYAQVSNRIKRRFVWASVYKYCRKYNNIICKLLAYAFALEKMLCLYENQQIKLSYNI